MQPRLAGIAAVVWLAAVARAQTPPQRGWGRLVAHDVEIVEGCSGAIAAPAPKRVSLAAGQPLPIPLPIVCAGSTLRFDRLRLTTPARTEPGSLGPNSASFDFPLSVSFDVAAEWSGGVPMALRVAAGGEGCEESLAANLNVQATRVCEWTSVTAAESGFTLAAQFTLTANAAGGPMWTLRSSARYAWSAAPVIERLELVQAVQSEDQRVPLYAGKPTQLRIFPAGAAPLDTRAQIQVKPRDGPGSEWRFTTPRSVLVPAQVTRASDARSFVIPLPASLTAAPGAFLIEAQLLTAEGRQLTSLARPVAMELIEAPRAPALGYVHVCEASADGRERVCPDAVAGSPVMLGAVAEQVLPVAALPQSLLGLSTANSLRRLARLRLALEDWPTLAIVLPSRGEWAGRLAGRWSPGLRAAFVSDSAVAGPDQLAAALAGLYGTPLAAAETGAIGFDLRTGSPVAPGWISTGGVDALAARLRTRPIAPAALPGAAEFFTISGTVARDGLSGALGHGFRSSRSLAAAPSDPAAPVCLQLTASGGETLRYCFALERLDESAGEDAFAVRIPWLAGARQISLLVNGVELASRTLSSSPPQAEFLTPLAGNRLPEGPVLVQWSGSDLDGDELRYDLSISTDGGATWLPVAMELDRTDFTIDTAMYPTSARVMLQLRCSDGMQSAETTVGPLEFSGAGGQLQAPSAVNLPPMLAGQTAEAVVTLSNRGGGWLTLDTAAINNPAVQIVAPAFPLQIPPGASTPLRLRLTPAGLGVNTATMALDGATAAARIAITGRAVNARGPQLELAPREAATEFGTLTVGQTRDLTVPIGNGGGAPLTVSMPRAPGPGFRVIGLDAPLTLPPGSQHRVSVRFQPTTAGSVSDALLLESDDPLRRTASVTLAGHAVEPVVIPLPKIEMRPAPSADFGNVRVGTPAQQTFTVRNGGRAPLVITRIAATPADYSVRDFPALPLVLQPDAEQLFFVRIDPSAAGPILGQMQVDSNDPATPSLRIGLSAVSSLPQTGTVLLGLDDGSFERYAGFPNSGGFYLNRVRPPAFPATLKAIRIYFGERSMEPGEAFDLAFAAHPTGTEELPSNFRIQTSPAQVRTPTQFVEYPLASPITIPSGDFLVGFFANKPDAAPLDTSTILFPSRTYASRDGSSWRPSALWPGFPSGVFAVRAVVDVGPR